MRTAWAALAFSGALAVFLLGPAFLPATFGPYPELRWGDVLDFVTPVAVLPAAWWLLRSAGRGSPGNGATLLFIALAGLWASGQGMHLAANAIGHLVEPGAGDGGALTHEFDEVISHYLWHAALLGLTAMVAWRALSDPLESETHAPAPTSLALLLLAAALFGFTFFAIVVEGQTGPMALPGAAVIGAGVLLWAGRRLFQRPGAAYVAIGFVVALVLCLAWAGLHGWQLVEFSKAGLID